ncbi:potassium channel SKOR-like protein [Tanacetum coccineum]|uniref:Potassium channel SKOR-like protein n=1 Tax=Tanacetum coccineum TaxID=301880 RepID=A0ABQ5J1N1_9ASTR
MLYDFYNKETAHEQSQKYKEGKIVLERSSKMEGLDKTTYGGFVDIDPQQDEISLRTWINHSIIESYGGGGNTCITSKVYWHWPLEKMLGCLKVTIIGSQRTIRVTEAMIMHKVSNASAPPQDLNPDHIPVENLSLGAAIMTDFMVNTTESSQKKSLFSCVERVRVAGKEKQIRSSCCSVDELCSRSLFSATAENMSHALCDNAIEGLKHRLSVLRGYGEIHAVNLREMIFVMVYVSFDMVLDAYLIDNMTALIVKGSETEGYMDRMTDLLKYMNRNRLGRDIRTKIKGHLRLQYEIKYTDSAILRDLPISIRAKVSTSFFYLAEVKTELRHNRAANWVLQREVTVTNLLDVDINNNDFGFSAYMPTSKTLNLA